MNGEPRYAGDPAPAGVISGSTTGSITTGGFSYDQPTLEGLVKDWVALADDYDRSLRDSEPVVKVVGPGRDFASESLASAATAYGRAYLTYLRDNREYCYNQAQSCQNALDDYLGVEHRNVTEIQQSGQQSVDDNGSEKAI
ncbi:MAG: hypothetical protein WBA97_02395 [Actinophytocola sp.]|uniref:hypothetical protein n=1 Tax=Actinophytocola sp. TaxID=1872138 RepID=UPI003C708AA9